MWLNGASMSEAKTPWNPSRKATARVTNPLPVPETCPHCENDCKIVNNSVIYGREYGEWPWAVLCVGCGAHVGLHPFTGIPLGTLATAEMRDARKRAKNAFNPLWQQGGMSRSDAYSWLATMLGITNVNDCHIAWFGIDQCNAVVKCINTANEKGMTP